MTDAEKRVAIAKDVIMRVEVGTYFAKTGTYCEFELEDAVPEGANDLKEVVNLPMEYCEVCGIGSIFVSKVRLFNNMPLNQLGIGPGDSEIGIGGSDCKQRLLELFDRSQLSFIECAFETSHSYATMYSSTSEVIKAVQFGYRYDDDAARLVAIMKNLIENNGEFIP